MGDRRRQAADVRRRDHVRQPGERGDGIWSGARPTSMAQPAIRRPAAPPERRLVDQVAARGVDRKAPRLHPAELLGADQVLGLRGRRPPARRRSRPRQQRAEVGLPDLALDDPDVGIERSAACRAPCRAPRAGVPMWPKPMMPSVVAAQLPAHARLGLAAGAIGERRAADAAREVDHHADDQLGDRINEARARPRDQHAGAARRRRRRRCGCRPRSARRQLGGSRSNSAAGPGVCR